MIKHLYSMRDRCRGFLAPFIDENNDTAARGFQYSCKKNDIIYFSPDDFSLYKLADFDDESGEIIPIIPPEFICNAEIERSE